VYIYHEYTLLPDVINVENGAAYMNNTHDHQRFTISYSTVALVLPISTVVSGVVYKTVVTCKIKHLQKCFRTADFREYAVSVKML